MCNLVEERESKKFISRGQTLPTQVVVQFYSAGKMKCTSDDFCTSILDPVKHCYICLLEGAIVNSHSIIDNRSDLLFI